MALGAAHVLLLALAVLTKGPLAVVLAGPRRPRPLRPRASSPAPLLGLHPFRSIFVFVLLVVPWYFFATRAGGPAYAYDLIVNQNWNRFFQAFDHIQPWWFYLESMWSDFFPWTALALGAPLVLARRGLFRERPELGFSATVAAVCFLFLSASQAKQGKYLLVAYPFAAVLVAALVAARRPARGRAGSGARVRPRIRRARRPGSCSRPRSRSVRSSRAGRRSSRSSCLSSPCRSASARPGPSSSSSAGARRRRPCSRSPPPWRRERPPPGPPSCPRSTS